MNDSKMSDILRTSLDGIKNFTDQETAIGKPIHTPSGVTVIPVSRVTLGFATGGLDFGVKKLVNNQNFGGGGGSGITITPIAFLTVGKNAEVNLINISGGEKSEIGKALSIIERSPEIIKKIKETLK